jgi:hypothetical protein
MSYRSRIYFTSEQRRTLTQLYEIVVIVALQQKIILISMRYGFFIVWRHCQIKIYFDVDRLNP